MKLLFRCAGVLVVATLAGCAVAPENAPRFTPAPVAPDGYATVYIYRLSAPPYTRDIKLSIAGKPVLNAPEEAYTWLFVRSGTHTLFAEWPTDFLAPKKWPDASTTYNFEPGKAYYFRVAGDIEAVRGGFLSPGAMVLKSYVAWRSAEVGIAELIACCRYMRPTSESVE